MLSEIAQTLTWIAIVILAIANMGKKNKHKLIALGFTVDAAASIALILYGLETDNGLIVLFGSILLALLMPTIIIILYGEHVQTAIRHRELPREM